MTSNDPDYRAKVHHIQSILGDLQEGEAFFSVDEFGPFSVRAQGGRALVGPDQMPTVPQYQKSKGVLIMTAALELSQNQITHFYSPRKDTGEMLRMLARLVDQYKHKSQIYVSWDAASWHMSKMLRDHVAQHNERIMNGGGRGPTVALAPLPAGAQFLNVIESVFSGLARAILANSNYESIDQARAAIDRYIRERNEKVRTRTKARRWRHMGFRTRTASVLGSQQLQRSTLSVSRSAASSSCHRGTQRMVTPQRQLA